MTDRTRDTERTVETLGRTAECWCGEDIRFVQHPEVADEGIWVHIQSGMARCYPDQDDDGYAEPLGTGLPDQEEGPSDA